MKSISSVFFKVRLWLTQESSDGILLLSAALIALIWANSPWQDAYYALSDFTIGPAALHLDLNLAAWAADGLLAIFFFAVGLELKQEFTSGCLSDMREASVPIIAAVGGMLVPAAIFAAIIMCSNDTTAFKGWAIPTATDIAFALAVLAIFGRGLPRELRTFLLTLATVDDLLAIIVIAVFYTASINWIALAISLAIIGVFALLANKSKKMPVLLMIILGIAAWGFMHASGVHATIAGVLMGISVPAKRMADESCSRSHHFEKFLRPFNTATVLPIFAFFAAGVTIFGDEGPAHIVFQPVVAAIILGLVAGKFVGVLGTIALTSKFTRLNLPGGISLKDLIPVGFLTGIGFTVSLLISELSYVDSEHASGAKFAVLAGSVIAAIFGALSLKRAKKSLRK